VIVRAAAVLVALLASTDAAFAQAGAPAPLDVACPDGSGIVVRFDGADRAGVETRLRLPLDTTIVFDVRERRWTRTRYAAALALAVGSGGDGTAGANRRVGPWRACAGVGVSMRDPTLAIRGASGRVRLRLDPSPRARAAPPRTESTRRPRR
jgi:hypothetical protein